MSRPDRIAQFRRQAAGGWLITSLRPIGAHHPHASAAIRNWYLREPTARPQCFACAGQFAIELRPSAFLSAVSGRSPKAGIANAAICAECWGSKTADEIESAAAGLLRRRLYPRGRFLDD